MREKPPTRDPDDRGPATIYTPPGSAERLALYERRAMARVSLFHPGDPEEDDRPCGPRNNAKPRDGLRLPPRTPRVVRMARQYL